MPAYDPNNIFAKILRGELPCYKVYEDNKAFAFLDIMPRAAGHTLVLPKTPARNILDVAPDDLAYVAKVAHNERPVAFRLSECEAGRFAFVNPEHDFPRRLEYVRVGEDAMRVRVSDGAENGFELDFRRQQAAQPRADAVLAAEDARFAAMVRADAASMRRWLAQDLAYVHSTGEAEDREQLIQSIIDLQEKIQREGTIEGKEFEVASRQQPKRALVELPIYSNG